MSPTEIRKQFKKEMRNLKKIQRRIEKDLFDIVGIKVKFEEPELLIKEEGK